MKTHVSDGDSRDSSTTHLTTGHPLSTPPTTDQRGPTTNKNRPDRRPMAPVRPQISSRAPPIPVDSTSHPAPVVSVRSGPPRTALHCRQRQFRKLPFPCVRWTHGKGTPPADRRDAIVWRRSSVHRRRIRRVPADVPRVALRPCGLILRLHSGARCRETSKPQSDGPANRVFGLSSAANGGGSVLSPVAADCPCRSARTPIVEPHNWRVRLNGERRAERTVRRAASCDSRAS